MPTAVEIQLSHPWELGEAISWRPLRGVVTGVDPLVVELDTPLVVGDLTIGWLIGTVRGDPKPLSRDRTDYDLVGVAELDADPQTILSRWRGPATGTALGGGVKVVTLRGPVGTAVRTAVVAAPLATLGVAAVVTAWRPDAPSGALQLLVWLGMMVFLFGPKGHPADDDASDRGGVGRFVAAALQAVAPVLMVGVLVLDTYPGLKRPLAIAALIMFATGFGLNRLLEFRGRRAKTREGLRRPSP